MSNYEILHILLLSCEARQTVVARKSRTPAISKRNPIPFYTVLQYFATGYLESLAISKKKKKKKPLDTDTPCYLKLAVLLHYCAFQ